MSAFKNEEINRTRDINVNRGYYMAARGYEFYLLRVLKVSLTRSRILFIL